MKWFQYSIFWRCLFKAFVSSKSSSFLKIFQALTYQVFPPPSLYFLVHDSFEASDSQIFFILVYSKQVERSQQILDTVADIQDFLSTLHVLKNDIFFPPCLLSDTLGMASLYSSHVLQPTWTRIFQPAVTVEAAECLSSSWCPRWSACSRVTQVLDLFESEFLSLLFGKRAVNCNLGCFQLPTCT